MDYLENGFEQTDRILRYLQGELHDEELERFEQWLAEDEENRLLLQRLQDRDLVQEKLDFMGALDTETAWSKLAPRTFERQGRVVPMRIRYVSYAAAVVLLLIGGWALIYITNQERPVAEVKPVKAPAAAPAHPQPGGDKARLVLGDGSVIVLDAAGSGTLEAGTGYRVRQQDGEVVYEVSAETAGLPVTFHTLSTPAGGQFRIVLPDGSKAWLNAASSLRFPSQFNGQERKVELTGEAYFEIAHNKEKPFRVAVEGIDIKVLGTHFNVMAYHNEDMVRTTLLEGAVRVQNGETNAVLQPGFEARIKGERIAVGRADVQGAVAWKDGLFQFRETDLATIMRQLERWYDVEVHYAGGVKGERFSGIIPRSASAGQVLEMLELTRTVKFTIEGRKVTVRPFQ